MKIRTIIAALIFLGLSAVKFMLPEKAAEIRGYIIPAISRDISIRDDIIALGRAISSGGNYIYVWEHWIKGENEESEQSEHSEPEDITESSVRSVSCDGFMLSEMVKQNLGGFEFSPAPPADEAAGEAAENKNEAPLSEQTSPPASSVPPSLEPSPPATAAPVLNLSAKVDDFLHEQAAFADYAVPANVSYEAPILPFEYAQPVIASVTSGFGYREHPIDGGVRFHYGTDFGVVDGDSISAFADGTAITVQEFDGYGLTVIIDHGDGFSTLYAHCSQILVNQGDKVKRGDKIALSGHSGRVTGPHLHFELMHSGKYLNPEFYF